MLVVQVIVAPVAVIDDAVTADSTGGAVALGTVTTMPRDVVTFPAASRATAVSVCAPVAEPAAFHVTVYGACVSSAPILVPSTLNFTPATPRASVALADTMTDPVTVAPATGDVNTTTGGVVSAAPAMLTPVGGEGGAADATRPVSMLLNKDTTTTQPKLEFFLVRMELESELVRSKGKARPACEPAHETAQQFLRSERQAHTPN